MKVLIITNLFPNNMQPERGIFNKQQFGELARLCDLEVVAPLPWVPPLPMLNQRYRFAQAPREEHIDGIKVYHPRHIVIPKILRALYGFLFFLGIVGKVTQIRKHFAFDCIFATWAYPDGFGAALIARLLNKPLLIKVHGSDINLYTNGFLRRKMIVYAFNVSQKIIAVTDELKKVIVSFGIPEEKICVIRNGVDAQRFTPVDRLQCRRQCRGVLQYAPTLDTTKKIILFVGNLVAVKGIEYLLEAVSLLFEDKKSMSLVIVGDGDKKDALKEKSRVLGIWDSVWFVGRISHEEMPVWLNAADLLCLPSLNEGCPNVVLEALACGKPVVASNVGGLPEIIHSEEIGILTEPGNPKSLAEALARGLEKKWDHQGIRQEALKFSWTESAQRLKGELDACLMEGGELKMENGRVKIEEEMLK